MLIKDTILGDLVYVSCASYESVVHRRRFGSTSLQAGMVDLRRSFYVPLSQDPRLVLLYREQRPRQPLTPSVHNLLDKDVPPGPYSRPDIEYVLAVAKGVGYLLPLPRRRGPGRCWSGPPLLMLSSHLSF